MAATTAHTSATTAPPVRFILPGGVDDPAAPSGGNTYDRRVCRELPGAGWRVQAHAVAGDWPRPRPVHRAELARILAAMADGTVVLLDGIVACGVPDIIVAEAERLRLAVLVHLPLADETGLAPATAAELDSLERRTLRAVSVTIATSDWAARRLTEQHGLDPARVHVALPGADFAPLATGSGTDTPRLLCVASVTPRKGQHRLVESLAALTAPELTAPGETASRWSCVCAGGLGHDPAYVARLRTLIDGHGLDGRFRLAGPQAGPALAAHYAAADVLVLPSYAETFGMAITEALAHGIPVVATAVGGVPEALGLAPDGSVPGILVPPESEDPEGLTKALRTWLRDPAVRRRTRASALGRRTALAGWDTTARRLAAALEHLRQEQEHRRSV
ncbi:glycosyltransferase family 4 protein [Streptomyces sp. NPDC093109]|uniref:glycosyltransferase family 4 protein n=1 Tax=Streptomyces sp. NPDC093109 TaxID=3154977 RepID=UPI00344FE961